MRGSLIFTLRRLDDGIDARCQALSVVSHTESRCHCLTDDPAAEGIWHRSLQSVAGLNPNFMIMNKDEDQHSI